MERKEGTQGNRENEIICTDTLMHTFMFLDFNTIVNSCSLVSKQFNRIAKSNPIWKILFEEKWLMMNGTELVHCLEWEVEESLRKLIISDHSDCNEQDNNEYWFHKCSELVKGLPRLHLHQDGEFMNNGMFQFKLENYHNSKKAILKLSVILMILFGDRPLSYIDDHVVISLRSFSNICRQEFTCSLTTFCLMILNPSLRKYLPIDEEVDDFHLCVSPFVKSEPNTDDSMGEESLSVKDCCFFTKMDENCEYNANTEELNFSNTSCFGGFLWCTEFFNAGSITYTSRISASHIGNGIIQINVSETSEYY